MLETLLSFAVCWGLKVDCVGVCTGGAGAGICGGESRLAIDESRIGFGGGFLWVFCCSLPGGGGGAKFGCLGTLAGDGFEIGVEDAELLEPVDGGFGGVVGWDFVIRRFFSSLRGGGFGATVGGG